MGIWEIWELFNDQKNINQIIYLLFLLVQSPAACAHTGFHKKYVKLFVFTTGSQAIEEDFHGMAFVFCKHRTEVC